MKILKSEKYFSIVTAAFVILGAYYFFWKKDKINSTSVFVLGRVYEIFDTENGFLYRFKYYFNGIEYKEGFKGSLALKDSLFVLKISTTNAKLWEVVEASVPFCITEVNSYYKSWDTLPTCNE